MTTEMKRAQVFVRKYNQKVEVENPV